MSTSSRMENDEESDDSQNKETKRIETYQLINAELTKTIQALKKEVARLKVENKRITVEAISARNETLKWKKRLNDSQKILGEHVNTLSTELQTFVGKMNTMFQDNNECTEFGDKSSNSSNSTNSSRRLSRSYESPGKGKKSPSIANNANDEFLDTIKEESEECIGKTNLRNATHSRITSASTIKNVDLTSNDTVSMSDSLEELTSIQSNVVSLSTTSHSSLGSNKENVSTIIVSKENESFQPLSPLKSLKKGNFVTTRRGRRDPNDHSIEDINMSDVLSSTPYNRREAKRKGIDDPQKSLPSQHNRRETRLIEFDVDDTQKSVQIVSRNSDIIENETKTSNTRPKRKASPISFEEPKLNTKLRRPIGYKKSSKVNI